jgi:hypothetical protein
MRKRAHGRSSRGSRDEHLELARFAALEALLLREILKTIVIVIYLGFAIWLLLSAGELLGFAPLLPWALWSRNELRRPP